MVPRHASVHVGGHLVVGGGLSAGVAILLMRHFLADLAVDITVDSIVVLGRRVAILVSRFVD